MKIRQIFSAGYQNMELTALGDDNCTGVQMTFSRSMRSANDAAKALALDCVIELIRELKQRGGLAEVGERDRVVVVRIEVPLLSVDDFLATKSAQSLRALGP
jgi:hypothetical protein